MTSLDIQPTLIGNTLTLRPLQRDDFDALHEAASDPAIWEQHPDSSRYQREIFRERFFEGAIDSGGALAVIDNRSGRIVGSSRYYEWDAEQCEVAIGYTFLERSHWGGASNREMKTLMLDHAFGVARIVWFHVAEINIRSRRAVEKLGAILDHELIKELDGKPFVQLYYRLPAPAWNDRTRDNEIHQSG